MDDGPLTKRITEVFHDLPGRLRAAARYVLDHPRDVALLSMREQARQAGLQPATMTRLAKHLGMSGYDELRAVYADAVRGGNASLSAKAFSSAETDVNAGSLAGAMVASIASQIVEIGKPSTMQSLFDAAEMLSKAHTIYCLSLRSIHPVAWHFNYIMSLTGKRSVRLADIASTGIEMLAQATPNDLLFCATVSPYTRATVRIAEVAAERKIPILALTDSIVSPIARIARHSVLVSTESPSYFHTMSPAFVVTEILASLVVARDVKKSLAALKKVDNHLRMLQTHVDEGES